MYKITLCYTAHNAGSDWLESEYNVTEHNYRSCIDDYITRFGTEADRLNQKWEHDSLFLNYYDAYMPISLRSKIEDYMDELSSEFGKFS